MKIEFMTSVVVITQDTKASRGLYMEALGLPLVSRDREYYATDDVDGCRHFGVWPIEQAAEACFDTDVWPDDVPTPQSSLEFEVASPDLVAEGLNELRAAGHRVLHEAKTEPWGQTIARVLSPDNSIVGISYSPRFH